MSGMDPFAVLGLDASASAAELAAAHRRLAKRWHPDRGGGPAAERRMAEINAAYDLARLLRGRPPRAGAAGGPPTGRAGRPEPGSWLSPVIRRALGPELLAALLPGEPVEIVVPAALWASPQAILVVSDRRLLWLLDDAPVNRVRSLPFHRIAALEPRPARLRRQIASLRIRLATGRQLTIAELRPATAARIARHVRAAQTAATGAAGRRAVPR